MQTTLVYETN